MAVIVFSSSGAEYEVKGIITQTITDPNVSVIRTTNGFTVYVRDCAWLIQTTETNINGNVRQREVGSTNGTDIYESNGGTAFVSGTGIPVELLDKGVDGHLWLMFASQCYWGNQRADRLTPVYDWQASVGADPSLTMRTEWELLNGPGSLPREVEYLGEWDVTNGLYRITGTNSVGRMLIPSGFVFEESHVGGLAPNSFVHEMVVRKRVEAKVTSVQPVCSRQDLLPVLGTAVVVDWRLKKPSDGNHVPTYRLPNAAERPSVAEAEKLLEAKRLADQRFHPDLSQKRSTHRSKIVLIVMGIFLAVPPIIYFSLQRSRKP